MAEVKVLPQNLHQGTKQNINKAQLGQLNENSTWNKAGVLTDTLWHSINFITRISIKENASVEIAV
jgi:hypothetical protein